MEDDANGDCLVNIFDVTYLITFYIRTAPKRKMGVNKGTY
jgi:hypothetical protein